MSQGHEAGTASETGTAARPTVTMADVAARAGVSKALVSIVFRSAPGASPESRERVMRAAAELDYRPDHRARLLGRGRSRTIGVVFGLDREFHGSLVESLYSAGEGSGWDLALGACAPSRDERAAIRALLEQRCEALVLLGPTMRSGDLADLAAQLPVVVVARALRSKLVDVVRTDDVTGGRLGVEHLAALGHRSLAHVDAGRAPGAAERRRGFREAVADLDLEGRVLGGGTGDADGARSAASVLASSRRAPGTTGVTVFNDNSAAGLLAAVRAQGLSVPGDLSLVGYDDTRVAALTGVALTTVAQDPAALARSAVELAVGRTQDQGRPCTEVVVEPSLVVRATTGPPR
jgi:DNA-binding LacI/PurR family transcriptional regulator